MYQKGKVDLLDGMRRLLTLLQVPLLGRYQRFRYPHRACCHDPSHRHDLTSQGAFVEKACRNTGILIPRWVRQHSPSTRLGPKC